MHCHNTDLPLTFLDYRGLTWASLSEKLSAGRAVSPWNVPGETPRHPHSGRRSLPPPIQRQLQALPLSPRASFLSVAVFSPSYENLSVPSGHLNHPEKFCLQIFKVTENPVYHMKEVTVTDWIVFWLKLLHENLSVSE